MTVLFAIPALLAIAAAQPAPVPPLDRTSWITNEDYPPEGVRLRMQGDVAFVLDVDVDGAVAFCTITASSGHALLDATTCRLMKQRAHYRMQRDEHSNPLPFQVRGTMIWRLPGESRASGPDRLPGASGTSGPDRPAAE